MTAATTLSINSAAECTRCPLSRQRVSSSVRRRRSRSVLGCWTDAVSVKGLRRFSTVWIPEGARDRPAGRRAFRMADRLL